MKHVSVAVAVLTATALLAPASTSATPMVPLAPACDNYKFSSFGNIVADTTIFIGWAPDGRSGRAKYDKDGYTTLGDAKADFSGQQVNLSINWDQGPGALRTDRFQGEVDANGILAGTWVNPDKGVPWHYEGSVDCVGPGTPANPAAGAKPVGNATVNVATDLYDKPDGKGQKIGTLYPGDEVPVMEPCHDDWCHVGGLEIGGYEGLTNGTAWVYTKGFVTFS